MSAVLAIVLVLMGSIPSFASWTSAGFGSGSISTATLAAPTTVMVPANGTSVVPVSWTAPVSSPGDPLATGYFITRTTSGVSTAACSSSPTALRSGTSCSDPAVPDGVHTYVVTAVYRSWTAPSSPSGTITVRTATRLGFSVGPANAAAGVAASPAASVGLLSAAGLPVSSAGIPITVAIAANPAAGTLSGTRTVNTDAGGVATFAGLSIDKSGVGYTLTATSTSPGLTASTSGAFTITAAAAARLVITTSAPTGTASTNTNLGPITVVAQDAYGNVVTAPAGGIALALSSSSAGATVFSATAGSASTTPVTIAAGSTSVSFYYSDTTVGAPTITVGSGTLTAATQAVAVTPIGRFVITTTGVNGIASATANLGPFTLQLQDASGNVVVAPTGGTVATLTSSTTGTAVFSTTLNGPSASTVTVTAGSSTATFYYGDTKAAALVITAARTGFTSGTQGVTVRAGTATKLLFLSVPATTTKNVVITPAVTALITDTFGNQTTSTATVTITSDENGRSLGGTKSRAAVAGQVTFSDLDVSGVGTYHLVITSTGLAAATSTLITSS